jgi:predicted Zn-dependent protease
MHTPDVELLWWEGCPSTERALGELREALSDVGLADVEVRVREIRTDADAREAGFVGSPTILIDGVDLAPAADDEAIGLSCRVYRRRDGGVSPTPDPDDLREALRRAAERVEVS